MTGAFIEIEISGLADAINRLGALTQPSRKGEALSIVGALLETQSRNRIAKEKRAPGGEPWKAWSPGYAASRHHGQSLLRAEGNLLDSLHWQLNGDTVEEGSNLVYAAIQQDGGTRDMKPGPAAIPARPYLGLSDANVIEIEGELTAWLAEVLQ